MSNTWKLVVLAFMTAGALGFISWFGILRVTSQRDTQKLFMTRKASLITGTSRAAKLNTEILNLSLDGFTEVYNYAFNLTMSSYGPLYYQSIVAKLPEETTGNRNIFVVCVDPWAVSASVENPEDTTVFRENSTQLNFDTQQRFAKARYFFNFYKNPYYTLFLLPQKGEVAITNFDERPDELFVARHVKGKLEAYRKNNFANNSLSNTRYRYLEKLIDTLRVRGTVYLTRLPVAKEMIELEREFAPEFDSLLSSTIKKYQVPFIDFYPIADQFLCPDGNHLFEEDVARVSRIIGEIILLHQGGTIVTGNELLNQYLVQKGSSAPL